MSLLQPFICISLTHSHTHSRYYYYSMTQHEVLLVGEIIKAVFAMGVIAQALPEEGSISATLVHLIRRSGKMFVLALIYGAMNILSYVSLHNIGAGMFTIFAQCKIMSTALFSSIILRRQYSWVRWRALVSLMFGVLLFTQPIWSESSNNSSTTNIQGNAFIGIAAVVTEVSLSGFASIYFEKVIKTDKEQMGIWERNFQLAFCSMPVYLVFIVANKGDSAGYGGGWSPVAWVLALLGAAGGLLVALSIKHGDSILKTIATTGAIILSSLLDHLFLGGPLTPVMMIAGTQVIIAIINYTFDTTPVETKPMPSAAVGGQVEEEQKEALLGTAEEGKGRFSSSTSTVSLPSTPDKSNV